MADKLVYEQLGETLYHERLPNGLDVYVLPKAGFQKTYATFSTKYGSIDNHFQVEGQADVRVPDGIAHFLEHKMFEEPTGDIFATFASNGASANAYTSFDRTTYLFSATERIDDNIATLLDFVQNPYFTDENVEKEKGIIGQEIDMYRDNPDWRSYFGLIEAMYAVHPVHIDIAGTVPSIAEITKETLYTCYRTFYHPSNMSFFVVGGVEPERTLALIRANQAAKTFAPQGDIRRLFDPEPEQVNEPRKLISLPVALPKCLFGFKELPPQARGAALMRQELLTKLMFDTLLGASSAIYQQLYEERLISDSFGHEYNISSGYAFSIIGGDTRDPDLLLSRIRELIEAACASGIAEADFERIRKKRIGGYMRMLNSPEAIAGEFTKYKFKDSDLFDVLPTYRSLTLDELNERMRAHFDWERMAVSIVRTNG